LTISTVSVNAQKNTQKSFQSRINNPLYLQKRQWECGKTVKNHSRDMTIVGGRAGSYLLSSLRV
jgi:hypothetical protein